MGAMLYVRIDAEVSPTTEQTPQQSRQKPLRFLRQFMQDMQGENGAGTFPMSALRVQSEWSVFYLANIYLG